MYFSNINNEELVNFHKIIPYNFNISLTKVLSSELFYIETIIPNKLYRILLLFYCEKISSSNPNDIILENKCIICSKNDEETYFNFISEENKDNVILNRLNDYYSFGDFLTDEEFNSIVQLLRVNNSFSEDIQINNSIVEGKYGRYIFNLKSTTIVDNGVLITNETLSSIGSVKLENPTFKNSKYRLKLTVYTLSDVNIFNDLSNDNIVKNDLIIDLIKNSEVNIPFNTLDLNCIVGFKARVEITHDYPVIQFPRNIVLSTDKSNYTIGDSIILTTRYQGIDSNDINVPLTFKKENEILKTIITNSEGIANYTYIAENSSILRFIVINKELNIISNTIEVKVDKKPTSITLKLNSNNLEIGEKLIISGVLKNGDELLTNKLVKILNKTQELYTLQTDSEGKYYKEITIDSPINYDLKAVYDGNNVYSSCESSYTNVKARYEVVLNGVYRTG